MFISITSISMFLTMIYPLVICYIADIAIENGPFIVDLPNLKIVIFPQLFQFTRGYSSIHTV